MARINLTERRIAALQPDPAGKRRPELRDSQVPGLVVRMAAKRKVYACTAVFPGEASDQESYRRSRRAYPRRRARRC